MEFSVTVAGFTTLVFVCCDVSETQLDGMLGHNLGMYTWCVQCLCLYKRNMSTYNNE